MMKTTIKYSVVVVIVVTVLSILGKVQLFDNIEAHSVYYRTEEKAAFEKDQPHLQIVGYVSGRKTFGLFNRKRGGVHPVSAVETALTVLCKTGEYYYVGGSPENYFRTLLNEEDHPLLVRRHHELKRLDSRTDKEAMREVMQKLQKKLREE